MIPYSGYGALLIRTDDMSSWANLKLEHRRCEASGKLLAES